MIFHLQVGNAMFTPTEEDLKKVVAEFKKATPVFTVPVKVVEIGISEIMQRMIIHVDAPSWDPEECEALRKQFEEAALHDYGIVATRTGIKVTTSSFIPQQES
jgi:hypothetical protein